MAAEPVPAPPESSVVLDNNTLIDVARRISKATVVAVFSGAGISAESGIPTFRGSGGLWDNFSPWIYGNFPGLALTAVFRHF